VTTHKPARVTVARVLRPHGRRGEVACEILTDFPDRLTRLTAAQLWDGNAEPRRVDIRSCWLSRSRGDGQAIFHFAGSDSISDAEKLVGLEVQIPLEDRMTLPSGSYYVSDLIGCDVRDPESSVIGRVVDVQFAGEAVAGTPILVLDSPRGEVLIPLAQEICIAIDVASRRIDVTLPKGLLDLNDNS
jgi:16S rRNA processing protein RimM